MKAWSGIRIPIRKLSPIAVNLVSGKSSVTGWVNPMQINGMRESIRYAESRIGTGSPIVQLAKAAAQWLPLRAASRNISIQGKRNWQLSKGKQ